MIRNSRKLILFSIGQASIVKRKAGIVKRKAGF